MNTWMKAGLIAVALPFAAIAADDAKKVEMVKAQEMPAGTYVSDQSHTSLTFKVSHLGLSQYTARFTDVKATMEFNPKDITKSMLDVVVNPLSVQTDYPTPEEKDFNAKLAKDKSWFNGEAFPKISYKATKIEKTSDTTGKITGDLSFLGVTKPLTLDVTFNGAYESIPFANVPGMGFSATATMKRSDWGFDTYVPMIGDDVTLLIETELRKQ